MSDKKSIQGYTLVELVVVIALISIVSLMTVSILSFSLKSNTINQDMFEETDSMRLVLKIIEKDIRSSSQNLSLSTDSAQASPCYYLSEVDEETVLFKYCLVNEQFSRNDVFIIDKISKLTISAITNNNVEDGLSISLEDSGGVHFVQKIYYRH